MLKVTVNDKLVFETDIQKDKIINNGKTFEWDITELRPGIFHIIKDNKSFTAELLKIDAAAKTLQLKINNHIFNISAQDELDLLLEKMGINKTQSNQAAPLKAPMPGLVLEVKVSENQAVKKGDPLVILEAMKMENILKAAADGVVKTVKIKKGETVEKNQVLIIF
jgi:biotin carboxyl carrier protein